MYVMHTQSVCVCVHHVFGIHTVDTSTCMDCLTSVFVCACMHACVCVCDVQLHIQHLKWASEFLDLNTLGF
jgi:hypothetical protein